MADSTPSASTLSTEAIIGIVAVIFAVPSFARVLSKWCPAVRRATARMGSSFANGAVMRPRNGGQHLLPLYSPSTTATTTTSSAGSAYHPSDYFNEAEYQQRRLVITSTYEESIRRSSPQTRW